MTPRIARARTPSRAGRCLPETARGVLSEGIGLLAAVVFDSSSLDTARGYQDSGGIDVARKAKARVPQFLKEWDSKVRASR